MRVAVIGAGAVGSYFGGRLAEAGHDVTFVVRENRAKQLAGSGLVILSPCGDVSIPQPKFVLDSREIADCELVILAVKNYQLAGAMQQLRPLVELGARILPLLNGVEHFAQLADEFGAEFVLGGICQIIVTMDAAGTIHHTSQLQRIVFGSLHSAQNEFSLQVKQEFEQAKLPVRLSNDVWMDIWTKYAFIVAYSGVTTASRLSIDQIAQSQPTGQVYARALQEMGDLARASGVRLPNDFEEKQIKSMQNYAPGSTSSMHQDLRKGLPLEVESLQGAAIRLGGKVGRELPTIGTLYGLLKPYEKGIEGEPRNQSL